MFDIAPTELLLVAVVALVVIGPKDLPRVLRTVGHWVGKARAAARQFRSGFDEMVREAELEELERKWKSENERIMREHPHIPDDPERFADEAEITPAPPAPAQAVLPLDPRNDAPPPPQGPAPDPGARA